METIFAPSLYRSKIFSVAHVGAVNSGEDQQLSQRIQPDGVMTINKFVGATISGANRVVTQIFLT